MLKSIANQVTKKARKVFRGNTIISTQSISVKDVIFHGKARRKHTTVDLTLHKKFMIFMKETHYHKL